MLINKASRSTTYQAPKPISSLHIPIQPTPQPKPPPTEKHTDTLSPAAYIPHAPSVLKTYRRPGPFV